MPTAQADSILIVGAGPVGALAALFLAKKGHQVELYERRPDLRREKISAGRSINIALSTRGLHALGLVGLEEKVLAQAIPMRGRMIHPVKGELGFQPYGRDESEYINSVSRGDLNKLLLTEAENTGRVHVHFNEKALSADLDQHSVLFKNEKSGETHHAFGRLLIGSDGSASCIRGEIQKTTQGQCSQELLNYGYKELHIDPGPGGSFRMEKHALHIWPRGSYMLIALPNFDGSFTCTLFLPFEGEKSFAELKTPEKVRTFFEAQFPDAAALISNLEKTYFENPTGQMVTVKTAPWHYGQSALLIGDAAHAIVPFFGQGMNCGFEDCAVLDQLFDRPLFEFESARKSNSDAIADLAVENFVEMRDKVGDARFLLERGVEKILENQFPGEFRSRYAMVTFARIPYRVALEAGRFQSDLLKELCAGISRPEEVDLSRAAELIRGKLIPFLKTKLGGEVKWT